MYSLRRSELQLAAVCLSLLLIVAAIAIGVTQCQRDEERADVLTTEERKALCILCTHSFSNTVISFRP